MLQLTGITCDYRKRGEFIENVFPQFSWKMQAQGRDIVQTSYRVAVKFLGVTIWDTGECQSSQSTYITYKGDILLPLSKYEVHVWIKTSNGESAYAATTFETGLIGCPVHARWIYSGTTNNEKADAPVHIFKGTFALRTDSRVSRARMFASALGIMDIQINKKRVSNAYFAPGNVNYHYHIPRVEYDVTAHMDNVIEISASVANGWYCGRVDLLNNYYGNIRAFQCEVHVFYEDGAHDVFISDNAWQWADDGPTRFAEIYDGEIYDARMTPTHWQNCKYVPTSQFKRARDTAYMGTPVTQHEIIKPIHVFKNKKGEKIYDMGQNFAGWVHLSTHAPAGTVITISHAEILQNGNEFFNDNFRYAKSQLIYTCRGGGEEYEPRFTYMGFRYVRVEGANDVELYGIAVHSDIKRIGDFECSNPLLNQLHHNIVWSTKSNFFEIPTDCPQRDERLGWTGDIAVFAPTAAYNFDIALFMRKWLYDLESEQVNGIVPFCVPDVGCLSKEKIPTCGWGDAATLVPWAVYMEYGDKDILARQYASMREWVDAEKRQCGKNLIWNEGFQFGDWLAPDSDPSVWASRAKWLAPCYFANSADILSKSAAILDKEKDADKYRKLCNDIKAAFVKEFIDDNGSIKDGFQSAYVCALHFDMLPTQQMRECAVTDLIANIAAHDGLLNTGFLGTPYLTFALCDNGHAGDAYNMLLNERCPSWLYQINHGATTIWERWDALKTNGKVRIQEQSADDNMVSFNHYANGSVGSFLYKRIAGLSPIEPGYKEFLLKPIIGGGLTYAKTTHTSPYGEIACGWSISKNRLTVSVTVPINTHATVVLPDGDTKHVGSGDYTFCVQCN